MSVIIDGHISMEQVSFVLVQISMGHAGKELDHV